MEIKATLAPAPFTLAVDCDARLLRIKFTGLWDVKIFDRYRGAFLAEIKKFQAAGHAFDIITDLTEYPPQHQYLNDVRAELAEMAKKMGVRKVAIIVSSAIVQYQVNRLTGKTYRFFTSEKEALAWIRS